jgi:hypothetical protein
MAYEELTVPDRLGEFLENDNALCASCETYWRGMLLKHLALNRFVDNDLLCESCLLLWQRCTTIWPKRTKISQERKANCSTAGLIAAHTVLIMRVFILPLRLYCKQG